MVAEDVQRMRRNGAGGHVDNSGKELSGNLIEVRDHKEKSLRSGEGSGKRTGSKASVNGACRTCLGLHLNDLYGVAEDVLCRLAGDVFAGRAPGIYILSHRAGGRDRVDGGNLGVRICNMRRSGITVHRQLLTGDLFSHKCYFLLFVIVSSVISYVLHCSTNSALCKEICEL